MKELPLVFSLWYMWIKCDSLSALSTGKMRREGLGKEEGEGGERGRERVRFWGGGGMSEGEVRLTIMG